MNSFSYINRKVCPLLLQLKVFTKINCKETAVLSKGSYLSNVVPVPLLGQLNKKKNRLLVLVHRNEVRDNSFICRPQEADSGPDINSSRSPARREKLSV